MNFADQSPPPPGEPNSAADAAGGRQQAGDIATGKSATGRATVRLRNVLFVVVPAAVLAVMAVASFFVMDMDALLADLSRPALVPAKGQVLYHGQPLLNAQIMTQPTGAKGASALGWTDDAGNFSLKTDIRGKYVEGATVGEHRVTVAARENISMVGGPPLVTPAQYATMDSSPLRITVGRNPDANQFKLVLEGDPPSRPQRSGKTKGKTKAKVNEVAPEQP